MGAALPLTDAEFLLTPLREGRLEGLAAVIGTIQFLLTPLREGRLEAVNAYADDLKNISTHAPAGGATRFRMVYR